MLHLLFKIFAMKVKLNRSFIKHMSLFFFLQNYATDYIAINADKCIVSTRTKATAEKNKINYKKVLFNEYETIKLLPE
jgi:hypothetical protein